MCRKTRTKPTPLPMTREQRATVDALISACEQYEASRQKPAKLAEPDRATWEVND